MLLFNEDVLFLIFEELKNDKKYLYSCLLVNKTWCVIAVQILWRNISQFYLTNNSKNIIYNVILLHLSEESRNILKNQGMNNLITETYQRPLFNYISFWIYLDLFFIEDLIIQKNIEKSNVPILRDEILKLIINKNTRFIHLSIPYNFDYQLHLIPGAEYCFSELESLSYDDNISQNILVGLAGICKFIKKIQLHIINDVYTDNCGIFKLIEMQQNLNDFRLFNISNFRNESFYKSLEESLIKHVNTIQYLGIIWNPTTRFLSHFVNLLSLEIKKPNHFNRNLWNDPNYLKNLSLPGLKILKVHSAPLNVTVNLIKSTTENLTEIIIHFDVGNHYDGCKMLIQAIYQNCPNIKYLKLLLNGNNLLISEFENLLINCQYLNGLIIINTPNNQFNWNELFQILTKSSPSSLYKFKFDSKKFKLEDMKSFFNNWKNRKPMLLKINHHIATAPEQQLVSLIEQYKAKGTVKKYSIGPEPYMHEDFEWF